MLASQRLIQIGCLIPTCPPTMNLYPTIICEFDLFCLFSQLLLLFCFVLRGTNVISVSALSQLTVSRKCAKAPRLLRHRPAWTRPGSPRALLQRAPPSLLGPNKDGKHSSYAAKHRAPPRSQHAGTENHETQPFCCESAGQLAQI